MESLLAALGLVFVAELGTRRSSSPSASAPATGWRPCCSGVAIAYMITNLLSVVIGGLLGAALPTRAIGLAGGVMFLGFALWNLRAEPEEADEEAMGAGRVRWSCRWRWP